MHYTLVRVRAVMVIFTFLVLRCIVSTCRMMDRAMGLECDYRLVFGHDEVCFLGVEGRPQHGSNTPTRNK